MKTLLLVLACSFGLSFTVGCGKDKPASVEDLGKAIASAVNDKNDEALAALFGTTEVFKQYLECPGKLADRDGGGEKLAKARAEGKMRKDIFEHGGELVFKEARKKKAGGTAKPGEELERCKVLKEFAYQSAKLVFDRKLESGETKEIDDGGIFVQFDGTWYILRI